MLSLIIASLDAYILRTKYSNVVYDRYCGLVRLPLTSLMEEAHCSGPLFTVILLFVGLRRHCRHIFLARVLSATSVLGILCFPLGHVEISSMCDSNCEWM